MSSNRKAAIPKSKIAPTTPIALRLKSEHLIKMDKIAANMGINRSAAIKIAIAEFIERRSK